MTPDTDPANVFALKPDNLNDDIVFLKNDWRAWMAQQPPWVHALAVAATLVMGFLFRHFTQAQPVPLTVTLVTSPAATESPTLVGATETRPRLLSGHHLFAEHMRHRAAEELKASGFKLAGGDATPLSQEKAERLVKRLTDDHVYTAGNSIGVWDRFGDGPAGPLLTWIRSIIQWGKDHPEEVQALLKLLLTILMAFA